MLESIKNLIKKYPKTTILLVVLVISYVTYYIGNNPCHFYDYGCGCPIYPTGAPTSIDYAVPKCKYSCYTTSTDTIAFASCKSNCGSPKNPAHVKLPQCLTSCFHKDGNSPQTMPLCMTNCNEIETVKPTQYPSEEPVPLPTDEPPVQEETKKEVKVTDNIGNITGWLTDVFTSSDNKENFSNIKKKGNLKLFPHMQYSDRSIIKQKRLKKRKHVRFNNILDIHTIY